MLTVLAHNITGTKEDGTLNYNVEVRINERPIFVSKVKGHPRNSSVTQLLRRIADVWDEKEKYAR